MKAHWIVKLKNPFNGMKLVAYEDGRVYVDGTGPLIGRLNPTSMEKIRYYINEYAHYIKVVGYEVQDIYGFIAKFWDNSNVKRDDLTVKGWPYEREFLEIIFNKNSYRKFLIGDGEFVSIMHDYLLTSLD